MNTFVIAEAGVNHNGSLEIAKKLVDVAVDAGSDSVKFQTFKAENIVTRYAQKAEYQKETTAGNETQFDMINKLELDINAHKELINYCKKKEITFLSTPFDLESVELLNNLGVEVLKIPSGEITNLPFLEKIGGLKKRLILSTGMADLEEIGNALSILIGAGTPKDNITVLHCNTAYPTPIEDVNLLAMNTIKETFKVKVGYSDHTPGIEISIAAAALGASVIEKHFTLDKGMEGPDHKASLEPDELNNMVRAIRNIESGLGNGIKKPSISELKNRPIVRKSIVAAGSIKMEEKFSRENITCKRPGTGISPMEWNNIIGKRAKRDFKEDELIEI
ncbi:MAG: N-acetylneuraminate synthase [Candidatus Scalindua sp.]|jgi:N,N'-diacetyllegionaminate synthase|nr:N-acetylneuraminate synthase [Candidatus Scalindua sp.]MBT6228347.1 N-acetylneuraminate synthase [Candidatus Scalindua sp.]